jgi:hypothetical protein
MLPILRFSPPLLALLLVPASIFAQNLPVAAPLLTPNGGAGPAPFTVKMKCSTPGVSIHVTTNGVDPAESDMEFDGDATIQLDSPATLKARAFLPDGSMSPVTAATFQLQPAAGEGAAFLEQEVPRFMAAGRTYRVSVSFRNVGTTPWTAATHQLVPAKASGKFSWTTAAIAPETDAASWAESEFSFVVTAPAEAGLYNFAWRVASMNGQPFGETSPLQRIQVLDPNGDPDGDGVPNWAELELGLKYDVADSDRNGIPDGAEDFDGDSKADAAELLASAPGETKPAAKPSDAEFEKKLVALLKSGNRTYQQLRAMGYHLSDAEFEAFIKARPQLFVAMRAARRGDEKKPTLPGSPAVGLHFSSAIAKITDPIVRVQLLRVLKQSAHSFKHLRAIGFDYPDEDFAALLVADPKHFRSARIIRRDENGKRIIPGWPAISRQVTKEKEEASGAKKAVTARK